MKWEKAGSSRVINKQSRRRLISMKMNEPSLKWTSSDQFHRQLKMCKNLIDDSQLEMSLRRIAFQFCAYICWPICIFLNKFYFSDTSEPCETCKWLVRLETLLLEPVIRYCGFEDWWTQKCNNLIGRNPLKTLKTCRCRKRNCFENLGDICLAPSVISRWVTYTKLNE